MNNAEIYRHSRTAILLAHLRNLLLLFFIVFFASYSVGKIKECGGMRQALSVLWCGTVDCINE